MEKLILPICSAEKVDNDEIITGYYVKTTNVKQLMDKNEPTFIHLIVDNWNLIHEEIKPETLKISFDNGKSFIKLNDLEVHICTDFGLTYSDMKMRTKREIQPANGSIFTIITDKGR